MKDRSLVDELLTMESIGIEERREFIENSSAVISDLKNKLSGEVRRHQEKEENRCSDALSALESDFARQMAEEEKNLKASVAAAGPERETIESLVAFITGRVLGND